MKRIPFAVFVIAVALQLVPYLSGCRDLKHPVPCQGQPYPDPCDGQYDAPKDAGRG